mmetsp:Transcript_342/g.333  ORF Transcript_342/g.333 Transcript_342/m.333 type:complete len:153 (+) Transcript_342:153-611(+)
MRVNIGDEAEAENLIPVVLMDTFPPNHPLLASGDTPTGKRVNSLNNMDYDMDKEEMGNRLVGLMKNIKYPKESKDKTVKKRKNPLKKKANPDYCDAFIFVFDSSEPLTEECTKSYFEYFQSSEASENQSVLASKSNTNKAVTEFWGNKSDME